jgi:hypothetical protein
VSADQRAELARAYLAEARQRSVEQLAPTLLMRECAELRRLLGQVLAVLAEAVRDRDDLSGQLAGVIADRAEDAAAVTALRDQLARIRAVLDSFDWEFDDRQLALEHIERIATGGEQ